MEKLLYTIGELLMTEVSEVDNVSYTAEGNMQILMYSGLTYTLKIHQCN